MNYIILKEFWVTELIAFLAEVEDALLNYFYFDDLNFAYGNVIFLVQISRIFYSLKSKFLLLV